MTTLAVIRDALADWVVAVTGREPVFDMLANMGPRPSRQFVSMVLSTHTQGHHFSTITELPGPPAIPAVNIKQSASFLNRLLISMNVVGGDTYSDMLELRGSIGIQTHRDTLWNGGLGFGTMSEVRDLTEVVKEDYEQRHQADWMFHAISDISLDISSIEDVVITNAGTPGSVFNPQAP